jgi:hypothetical protein
MIIGAAVPTMIQMTLLLRACQVSGSVNISMTLASPTNSGVGSMPSKSTTEK